MNAETLKRIIGIINQPISADNDTVEMSTYFLAANGVKALLEASGEAMQSAITAVLIKEFGEALDGGESEG